MLCEGRECHVLFLEQYSDGSATEEQLLDAGCKQVQEKYRYWVFTLISIHSLGAKITLFCRYLNTMLPL